MHLTKTNLLAGFLLTSRKHLTQLMMRSCLKSCGIRGIANDWFKSYLTKRMQYVSIDGILSDTLKVNFGVPQGSVFGPLLDFPLLFILPMIQVF